MDIKEEAIKLVDITNDLHNQIYRMNELINMDDAIYDDIVDWGIRCESDLRIAWQILGYIEFCKQSNKEENSE